MVFEAVDEATSSWRADSEVRRLSSAASGESHAIGSTLQEVLRLAFEVAEASGGAFDPTVGPLVRLWGFGPDGAQAQPTEQELQRELVRVGWESYRLEQGELTTLVDGLELDLSGVAKGYAVDGMAAVLAEAGAQDFLVEIGGEFVAYGERPGGGAWRLGIERPAVQPGAAPVLWRAVDVSGRALATSGNYRNVRGAGDQRYGHTIDPRTGRPVSHNTASVSVLAPTCALADALATALLVLGPEHSQALLDAYPGVEAIFLVEDPLVEGAGGLREVTLGASPPR